MALHVETQQMAAIQTKSASPGNDRFALGPKDEAIARRDHEWYLFVGLRGEFERPEFYIVPRDIVGGCIYAAHREWLNSPGRGGRQRNDSAMRELRRPYLAGYRDRWDLLLEPTGKAPFLMDGWFVDIARKHPDRDGGFPLFAL